MDQENRDWLETGMSEAELAELIEMAEYWTGDQE